MACDPQALVNGGDQPPPEMQTPLLDAADSHLAVALRRLECFLAVLGFHHASSSFFFILSCFVFLLLGVVTPILCIYFSHCSGSHCDEYQIDRFEFWVLFFEAVLAGVSLGCVSRNLFKYGIRRFLFVDQHHGHLERFQTEYVRRIQAF